MHRNSQKRYYWDYIYSITCNTQNKFPFFKEKEFCDLFVNVLSNTKKLKNFELYAFCLNYDHFHILLRPDESVADVSKIMQCLKKNVSQDINKIILKNIILNKIPNYVSANSNSRLQEEGEIISQSRCENIFTPTEDGGIFSKNVSANSNSRLQEEGEIISQSRLETVFTPTKDREIFSKNVSANSNLYLQEEGEIISQCRWETVLAPTEDGEIFSKKIKFQRQKSFHDHIIRNEWDFIEHLKYIQFNYLKHDIPDNRKYTSYKNDKLIDYLNINW